MLFWPFYEPLRAQVKEFGWRWLYSNGTGFLDLPSPPALVRMVWSGAVPTKVVVDLVYPLVFGVGAVMSSFFGFHLKYVLNARTTLEQRVLLETAVSRLVKRDKATGAVRNPFDQGGYKNLTRILGPNLFLVLLPVPVRSPPPYIPSLIKTKGR